jgi:hypothetical protein
VNGSTVIKIGLPACIEVTDAVELGLARPHHRQDHDIVAWRASDDLFLQEYTFAMSGSDFRLTESVRAVFTCERGTVQFYFVDAHKDVGKSFLYTLEEAADLGAQILKTGTWMNFQSPEFPTRHLEASVSAYGITQSTSAENALPARTIGRMIDHASREVGLYHDGSGAVAAGLDCRKCWRGD